MNDLERAVADLVRQVEYRFHGKYRGMVVDNNDPEKLGRIKVQLPSVLGDEVVTGWALPCVPYGGMPNLGLLAVPEIGAGVWIEFEEGDLEFPVWVGTYWSKPGGETEVPKSNGADGEETEVSSPPTRKIFKTVKGHTIQFEDADGEEMIVVREAVNGHTIALNSDGVRVTDGTGNYIEMTGSAFTLHSEVAFTIDAPGQAFEVIASKVDFTKG